MLESPVLRAPGVTGVFDPNTNTVGLPYDLEKEPPMLGAPSEKTWSRMLQTCHEWAHFYQFSTTSYGHLYQTLSHAQTMTLVLALQTYREQDYRLPLPLLNTVEQVDFQRALDHDDMTRGFLRLAYILERYRRFIFGYSEAPEPFGRFVKDEWAVARNFLWNMYGTPRLSITNYQGNAAFKVRDKGYRITDLLESHAHALSSLWMMQKIQRHDLPKAISRQIMDHANDRAVGSYGALLRFAPDLPVSGDQQLFTFCALCDMALNPPGLNRFNAKQWVTIPDVVWDPTTRALEYLVGTIEGNLSVPTVDLADYPAWEHRYLDAVREDLGIAGNNIVMTVDLDRYLDPAVSKILPCSSDEVELPVQLVALSWLDSIGTYGIAVRLRETVPMLLGGATIEELEYLVKHLAGPNAIYRGGEQDKIFSRICMGLSHLGIAEQDNLFKFSDFLTHGNIGVNEAIRKLFLMNHEEAFRQQHDRPFGPVAFTLSEMLRLFDLSLDDFD